MTSEALWITTAAQMGMGFILPFALTFVAIPLETFIQTLRHVLGMAAILAMRLGNLLLRITGSVLSQSAVLLQHLYDVAIFAPLWAANRLTAAGERRAAASREAPQESVVRAAEHSNRDGAPAAPRYDGYGEATV